MYSQANKGLYSQGYGLASCHVRLWELDDKKGKASKNWCLQTVVLEKTPESPLDSKEIKPVNLKGNQPWIHVGRTDAEAPVSTLGALEKSLMLGKIDSRGEEGVRGWDGWMAQWIWTWANFRRWWGTGRPGMLKSMGSQRVGHDWMTEQQLFFSFRCTI